jgi:hypothetical protein
MSRQRKFWLIAGHFFPVCREGLDNYLVDLFNFYLLISMSKDISKITYANLLVYSSYWRVYGVI